MYRLYRIVPLAAVLFFHLGASHADIQLSDERVAEEPVNEADRVDRSGQAGRVVREQAGLGNRQELNIGGSNGRMVVDHVVQKQTGVGNRQVLNLGVTDQ